MQRHAAQLAPGFAALGYPLTIHLQLDDAMLDGAGFREMSDVMGDAIPSGRVRLRPSWVCGDDAAARAVVAHEMAHVALQHKGVPATGLVLAWEGPPRQENEANELGLAVLRRTGGYPQSERFLECRLRDCSGGTATGGNPAFRGPPLKAVPTAP
jgi:hypothetical protein